MAVENDMKVKITCAAHPALNQMLFRRTVTVVWHDDGHNVLDHGSGILLQVGEESLVITAAHVIRDRPIEQIHLVATNELSNVKVAPVEMDFMGGGCHDQLDVGFLRLSAENAATLADREFASLDEFDVFPSGLPDDLIYLFGMPEFGHEQLGRIQHSFRSFTYIENIQEDYAWAAPGPRPLTIDLMLPQSVENAFDGRRVDVPDLRGMSGGGIWRVSFQKEGIWTPQPRLVGIIAEMNDHTHTLNGNRLEALLHLLAIHFPAADQFLEAQIEHLEHRIAAGVVL